MTAPALRGATLGTFAGRSWAHCTPRLRALELGFAVRATDAGVGRYVERVFRSLTSPGAPERVFSLVVGDAGAPCELWLDDVLVARTASPGTLLSNLLWAVNRAVVAASSARYLLVHAAAAELGGRAVLLPGPSGSGKSTLVAGLVGAGLRYVTDEAAAIEPATLRLHPFPKPLTLDATAGAVLPELRPHAAPGEPDFATRRWDVDPAAIRPDAVAPPCEPAAVVAPTYVPGATTALVPMTPAEAVVVLAECSFNFARHGAAALDACARIARGAPAYRLVVGRLDAACELVVGLLRALPAGG